MNSKLQKQYGKDGTTKLKWVWWGLVVFGGAEVICAISAAAANSKVNSHGYKSASFTAIWGMLLVVMIVFLGGRIVLRGRSHPILVGFMIGLSFMLAELMFVIMCIFFGLGTEAAKNKWTTAPTDNAMGSFSMFNMILYIIWGTLLVMHRQLLIVETVPNQQQEAYDDNIDQETPNPSSSYVNNDDDFEAHDQQDEL